MEKLEPFYTVVGSAKWYSHYGKQYGRASKKLRIELLYDPIVPLVGIHPKELKAASQEDICTPVFIAALFTIANRWKQPKYPLTDEWINVMWHVQKMEYYSALKRKEMLQ